MTPEIIQAIAQFMQRVDLKGSEVEAFQACMQALGQEMQRLQEASADGPDSPSTDD